MNAPPLNDDEYRRFGNAMGARVMEHYDGFCILGFHALTGQPVIYTNANSLKTRMAMTELLRVALIQNAVVQAPMTQPPPDGNSSS